MNCPGEPTASDRTVLDASTLLRWMKAAAPLPGKSFQLAMLILISVRATGMNNVLVGNAEALEFGIDRNAKYRALSWLEDAGLVLVDRKLGRSPVVTVLEVEKPQDADRLP